MFDPSIISALLLAIGLAAVAVTDWRSRKIGNRMCCAIALFALLPLVVNGQGLIGGAGWLSTGINVLLATLLLMPGWLKGVVGGGDLKLMWALTPIWPVAHYIAVFFFAVVTSLVLLGVARLLSPGQKPQPEYDGRLRLGTGIGLGALICWVLS